MSATEATHPEATPDPGGPGDVRDGAGDAPAPAGAPAGAESQVAAPAGAAPRADAIIPSQEEYVPDGEHLPDGDYVPDAGHTAGDGHVPGGFYLPDGEYVPQERPQQPVSKLAIGALVSGLLALIPLALGLGIAALIEIRRTGHRGARLAVGGIYAAWIWVLIAAAGGGLYWFTHGFRPQVHTQYQPAATYGLQVGECFNTSQNAAGFTLTGCSSPHETEVYGRLTLAGSAYPGAAAVQLEAARGCAPLLQAYANPSLANIGYDLVYVYPDRPAWAAGERTVICEAHFTNGTISGSIRAAG